MENKLKLFFPIINEIELIEAKLEYALGLDMEISVVEGHHPAYTNVDPNGLSVDGTTEILISYDDRIKYLPVGKVDNEMELRNLAYKYLSHDPGIALMFDTDEFMLEKDLIFLDGEYKKDKDLKYILTNSYIFLDGKYCAPHIQRFQSKPFPYSDNITVQFGQWHERIFRYNKWYSYHRSPFLINDFYGRFLYNDEIYYNERLLFPEVYLLHYKNFKRNEAEKRTQMYDTFGDGIDHSDEWNILEKNKFEYKGEHPPQIAKMLASFIVAQVG